MRDDTKICTACSEWKPLDDFYPTRKGEPTLRRWCKQCVKANVMQWQRDNPERHYKKQRRSDLKRRYGMTESDLAAMLERQEGRCAICGINGGAVGGLKVDHCHTSGRVRGLLCALCNTGLGMFEDDEHRMHRAAAYLDH